MPRPAVMTLAILAASCAPRGPIDHPQGSGEVVIRVEVRGVGPMHPAEVIFPKSAWFTLYGDGRVILEDASADDGFVSTFTTSTLSERGIQRLLRQARAAGLEGDARELNATGGTDVDSTTHVVVVAAGSTHTTSAWSLWGTGEAEDGLEPRVSEGREALRGFLSKLADLEGWLGEDLESGPEPFEPDGWAVVWAVVRDPALDGPWDEVMLEDFRVRPWPLEDPVALGEPHPRLDGIRCGVMGGDALNELRTHIQAGTLWESDGVIYWLYARPLLPDETDCWAAHG